MASVSWGEERRSEGEAVKREKKKVYPEQAYSHSPAKTSLHINTFIRLRCLHTAYFRSGVIESGTLLFSSANFLPEFLTKYNIKSIKSYNTTAND